MYTLPMTLDLATARRRSRSGGATGKQYNNDDEQALQMAGVQNLKIVWVQDFTDISQMQ
jgi:hypothetical protein